MTAGRPPKKINEYFFDKETKESLYVWGILYSCYTPVDEKGIIIRSSHKDLVQIVKNELESEHAIIPSRGRDSYFLQIKSAPYLRSRLEEMELDVPKKEREFPKNIPKDPILISHLSRGLVDGRGRVGIEEGKYTTISIAFNYSFLMEWHKTLVQYAGVQRAEPSGKVIKYGYKDAIKIYNFIYQDWDYIKKHGLYLPAKKELFIIDYQPGDHPMKIKAHQKIEKAKKMLLQMPLKKVAQKFYVSEYSFYQYFKKVTGKTASQWVRENK